MPAEQYEPPELREYGSVESLTQLNKVGSNPDTYSASTNGDIVGSVVSNQ